MKKLLAIVLSTMLVFGLTACGGSTEENNTKSGVIEPTVEAGTFGATLWDAFVATMEENASATALDIANVLVTDESILFSGAAMNVEAGFLAGFTEEINGFADGAMYAPMIGSIPFVGYVFVLEEGADVEAFMTTLSEKSDPRWNICVEAEQTVIGAYNNTVFFLMCPKSNEG